MLRLPKPLLRARGTLMPPDDWPEGATLGLAWRLKAVCAVVSALAADPPMPPVDTAGAGVLLPVTGGGDLCPVMGVDDLLPAAGGATFIPPPARATSALSPRGADPPMTLM